MLLNILTLCLSLNSLTPQLYTDIIPSKTISVYDVKKQIDPINSANALSDTYNYKQKIKVIATAYTASADECGNNKGVTASGKRISRGMVATHSNIPFGTQLDIETIGTVTVTDRGSALHWINDFTLRVDVFMESKQQAKRFGVKTLDGYIYRTK